MTQEEKIRHKIGEIVAAHSLGVLFASQSNKVKELQEEDQKTMFFIYDLFTSELNRKVEGVVKKYEKVLQNFSTGRHYLDHDDATYRDGMLEAYENVLEDLKSLLNNTKESK